MKKECDFCRGAKYISGTFSASGPMPNGGSFVHQIDGDVDYCPMCGRNLTEDTSFKVPSYEKGKNEAIKHGYWHDNYCIDKEHYMTTCSNCGHTQRQHMNGFFIYCPNCGSKNVETVG